MKKSSYTHNYYQQIKDGSLASAREVIPVVSSFVQPASVLDVGCGVGTWLSTWKQNGVQDILGLDGDYVEAEQLLISAGNFQAADLGQPLQLNRSFDLVMSLEVAEHIPAARAATFVANLCNHGEVILFSAAIPGQGGVQHVNEQYPAYWIDLFKQQGYTGYDCLRPLLWHNKKIDVCYRQNLLFFVLDAAKADYAIITQHNAPVLPLVHPEHFQKKEDILVSYKRTLRTPLHAAWFFVKKWLPFLRPRHEN